MFNYAYKKKRAAAHRFRCRVAHIWQIRHLWRCILRVSAPPPPTHFGNPIGEAFTAGNISFFVSQWRGGQQDFPVFDANVLTLNFLLFKLKA